MMLEILAVRSGRIWLTRVIGVLITILMHRVRGVQARPVTVAAALFAGDTPRAASRPRQVFTWMPMAVLFPSRGVQVARVLRPRERAMLV